VSIKPNGLRGSLASRMVSGSIPARVVNFSDVSV
jgi:hypothetical protein